MKDFIRTKIRIFLHDAKLHRRLAAVFLCLALLVSGSTLALLTLPGIALARTDALSLCPYAQHTHDASCMDENGQYCCGYAAAHLHDDLCYNADGKLICPLEEIAPHTHDASCYETAEVLICEQAESSGHHHGPDCYTRERGALICRNIAEDHVHDASCYEWTESLHCDRTEGEGAHVHTADCYAPTAVCICGQQELPVHVHTEECFGLTEDASAQDGTELSDAQPESDPEADLETAEIWEQSLANTALTGDWSEDLIAIAKSQLGYRESERNFALEDGVRRGYTRYGAWYGAPYDDWCAMFIAFCLHYAGIPAAEMPRETSCNRWIDLLQEQALYHPVREDADETSAPEPDETNPDEPGLTQDGYRPVPGDLVFFRMEAERGSDHVGIVCALDEGQGTLETIAGNSDDRVQRLSYALDDERIVGYGALPAGPRQTLRQSCVTPDGAHYHVTVVCGKDAGVPRGASLLVAEIPSGDRAYDAYVAMSESALGWDSGSAASVRLLDIKIVDRSGEKIEIAAPVEVTIELEDNTGENGLSADSQLVHIPDDAEVGEVVDSAEITGDSLSFTADGFSAYAIVTGPDAIEVETVSHTSEIQDGVAYYLSYNSASMYVTNALNANNAFVETNVSGNASEWFLEPTGGTDEFYLYTYVGGSKLYVKNTSGNLVGLVASGGTALTLSESGANDGTFYFKITNQDKWLQHSNGGKGFRFWTDNNNAINSRISITKASSYALPTDPYGLDGKTYGLMSYTNGLTGKALMANALGADALQALSMTVLANQNDRDDLIFTPKNSGITRWTFHAVVDDQYYLTAEVEGETKYLKIDANGVYLSDAPCRIQVVPGAGSHAGEICLRANGNALSYSGAVTTGFFVGGIPGSEWLRFVDETQLTPDYYMIHAADKVSVSDRDRVQDGAKVIIYTRVWNEAEKRYDFYAIDHNGSLLPVYESGDEIQWFGNRLNTLLWDFTEYHWEGTDEPNYYYDLYNEYSQKYIAPQVSGGQILSDEKIGVNLNGRRNGYYYTNILAWDDANYAYAGINAHIGTAGDRYIQSCQMEQTDDFYFALVHELPTDDHLTPVPTVDNAMHGITMKLVDFDNVIRADGVNTSEQQHTVIGDSTGGAVKYPNSGLLSTNLDEFGYPTATKTGKSMAELFGAATPVNHLFIESIYEGSGYFEYDSTQNYAQLDGNRFTVYQELGTSDIKSGVTMKHGQFLPYNSIEPGVFSVLNPRNLYSATAEELSDADPRKNERLYLVNNPNYYFGMELEASFVQTPNGHDAWGHDIIYEFTGDDDFWLYVDGELVIDLGGIHSALPGTVNYCTGEVNVNGNHTSLYNIFKRNYKTRNPAASEAEVNAHLAEIFEDDGSGRMVFKDYTEHTMKIFYMERGAGASNLHMRFNLASVKPGTVQLTKQLGGVDTLESVQAEFPYQIWYKVKEGENEVERRLTNADALNIHVVYKDTVNAVPYKASHTVGGVTYPDVFLLPPGQTAEIKFPDDTISYRIVECGVDTQVFNNVTVDTANDAEALTQTPAPGSSTRCDFSLEYAETKERPQVVYTNYVDEHALRNLTIRKRLFAEDGVTEIHHDDPIFGVDSAIFGFRLYFRTENAEITATDDGFQPANLYAYHVKDNHGNYCYWNAATRSFDSLDESVYANLSAADKVRATFHTSMNGSISKIPVDYDVEIREIIAGTEFRVVERDSEIPDGYSRRDYTLKYGDSDPGVTMQTAPEGVMPSGEDALDPHVDVNNLRGWGLRVNKIWNDADYMDSREPIYVAIFLNDSQTPYEIETTTDDGAGGTVVTRTSTVRRLDDGVTTMYWYLPKLAPGTSFNQYHVREVVLTNPVPAANGTYSYDALERIDDNETMTVSGVQKGFTTSASFTYTATNAQGTPPQGSNVRVDTITNSRPGVTLRKVDWDGNPLAGSQFMLSRAGTTIGPFTSDASGLITLALLGEDVDYTLTEIRASQGYVGLQTPLTLRLNSDHTLRVTAAAEAAEYYSVVQSGTDGMPELTVKNRSYTLHVYKRDGSNNAPLEGVSFALHREVTVNGITEIDFTPIVGYEALVTDINGVIPKLDHTLPAGVYYLEETAARPGYIRMTGYLRFSIDALGRITVLDPRRANWLTRIDEPDDTISYVMSVPNTSTAKINIWKTDLSGNTISTGARFTLYRVDEAYRDSQGLPSAHATELRSGVTGADGKLALGTLEVGSYRLVETDAPDGYMQLPEPIHLEVAPGSVTAIMGMSSYTVEHDGDSYTVCVPNNPGAVLPATGGIGRELLPVLGAIFTAMGGILLLWRRRVRTGF